MNKICLNDIFGRCTGEPKCIVRKVEWLVSFETETREIQCCRLDITTCGKYKRWSEEVGNEKPINV